MSIAPQKAPPSTLADVIGQVIDAFSAMGDPTPILVGKAYLDRVGSPDARVLFVPETKGKIDAAYEMGGPASITHGCDIYVRGAESGDDIERFRSAYALADRVVSVLAAAASGRIEWGTHEDESPTDVDAFGAELVLSFSYTRDVWHDTTRWELPAADASAASAQPAIPPGVPGTIDSIDVTTEPVDPEET